MSEDSRTSFPATLLASVACALSVFLLVQHLRDEERPHEPFGSVTPPGAEAWQPSADELAQDLAATVRSADVALPQDDPRRALVENAITELTERIAQLEARLAQMQSTLASGVEERGPELPPKSPELREQERLEQVQTARAAILDPRMTEKQKVDAWGELRHLGEDAWDAATVAEMVRIGQMSTDPDVRADVWRQADARARSEALVPALIQALAQDAHAQAREEAAETLANYLDSPQVRMALEAAAAGDQDDGVRRQASDSLRDRR